MKKDYSLMEGTGQTEEENALKKRGNRSFTSQNRL